MADWNKPTLGDTYIDRTDSVKGRDEDTVRLNDTRASSATNLPDYAKRWDNVNAVFQNWFSSVWSTIVLAIAGGGTGATTAAGARTNLDVYSEAETDSAIDTDVATHNAVTNPHSATEAATPSRIIMRGNTGKANVVGPEPGDAATRIATKGYVDAQFISGTYTPSLTNVANISSSSAVAHQYMQTGSVVTVSGKITLVATTAGILTRLGVSFPIASSLVVEWQCSGVAIASSLSNDGAYIRADSTNDRAELRFTPASATTYVFYCTWTYVVV